MSDHTAATVVKVSQSGAGTDTLYTPAADKRVYVTALAITLDTAGTLKFTETAGDLTGTMNLAANGGVVVGTGVAPILWTSTDGEPLEITTTAGKAQGWLLVFEDD